MGLVSSHLTRPGFKFFICKMHVSIAVLPMYRGGSWKNEAKEVLMKVARKSLYTLQMDFSDSLIHLFMYCQTIKMRRVIRQLLIWGIQKKCFRDMKIVKLAPKIQLWKEVLIMISPWNEKEDKQVGPVLDYQIDIVTTCLHTRKKKKWLSGNK